MQLVLYKCILLTACFGYLGVLGFEVPPVQLQRLDNGFQVYIRHERGIQSAMFVIEIDGKCPAMIDYLTSVTNGNWVSVQKGQKLLSTDQLVVYLMVQYNNDIYTRADRIYFEKDVAKRADFKETVDSCNALESIAKDACLKPQTIVPGRTLKCANELIFEEDFSDSYRNNWVNDIYIPRYDDFRLEFVLYDDSNDNIFIRNGHLHIRPTLNPVNITLKMPISLENRCTLKKCDMELCEYRHMDGFYYPPPAFSAKIHSKFSFMYGRVEIRAKLPKGDWLLPFIMLENVSWRNCNIMHQAQLRVAFAKGNDNRTEASNRGDKLYGGPVVIRLKNDGKIARENFMAREKSNVHFGDEFHNYTLTWTKDKISVARDGAQYGCFRTDSRYFSEQFNIVLAVSAGGLLEFDQSKRFEAREGIVQLPWDNTDPKAAFNFQQSFKTVSKKWDEDAIMKIDYIRVYAV